jgi:hypothetical protein
MADRVKFGGDVGVMGPGQTIDLEQPRSTVRRHIGRGNNAEVKH